MNLEWFHGRNIDMWLLKDQPRALVVWCNTTQGVHRRDRRRPLCGLTVHFLHNSPTLRLLKKAPCPAQPMSSSTKSRGAGYGLYVNWRGINATVVPHLANSRKPLFCTVSEIIDKFKYGGVRDCPLTDGTSIEVYLWGSSFLPNLCLSHLISKDLRLFN